MEEIQKMCSPKEKTTEAILFNYPFKMDKATIEKVSKNFPEARGMIPEKIGDSLNWKEAKSDGVSGTNNQESRYPEPIFASYLECLESGKYLNDVLINFWMKWYVLFVEHTMMNYDLFLLHKISF